MREAYLVRRARPARLVATLAALFVVGLVAPGQAAANHYARALPSQLAPKASSAALAAPVQWCGNDTMSRDRIPDAVGGSQIHVIYAYPSDRPSRLHELASGIATDLAAIDEWWRRHDPLRAPRYDTFPFPGCQPGFGQLDIAAVQLPGTTAEWADIPAAGELAGTLYTRMLGAYGSLYKGKKYLVYWDAPAPKIEACAFSVESVNVFWNLLTPPQPGCPPGDVGQQAYSAMVTTHEMVHNLGASRVSAPHDCLNGHVCDDARDVLYGRPTLRTLAESILDVGRDDYYGHSGRWTDVQDSPFLSRTDRPRHVVTITVDPPAGGNVWTDGPGLGCPDICRIEWEAGSGIDLRMQAAPGYRFAGWSGSCSGRLSYCRRTVAGDFTASARFTAASSSPGTGPGSRNRAPRALVARLAKFMFETDETIGFSSASVDSDGTIAAAEWDFGDGTKATGASATHVYSKAGRFRVTLKVTDDDGAVARMTQTVAIRLDPPHLYLTRGFGRPGSTLRLGFRANDQTALSRFRVEVWRGRRIVKRQAVQVAGVRYTYGSVKWRAPVRPGKAALQWCAVATDVFKHTSRICAPITLFGTAAR